MRQENSIFIWTFTQKDFKLIRSQNHASLILYFHRSSKVIFLISDFPPPIKLNLIYSLFFLFNLNIVLTRHGQDSICRLWLLLV